MNRDKLSNPNQVKVGLELACPAMPAASDCRARSTSADNYEAMYFRFGAALVLAVLVAVSGIALEKRCLTLRLRWPASTIGTKFCATSTLASDCRRSSSVRRPGCSMALENERREVIAGKASGKPHAETARRPAVVAEHETGARDYEMGALRCPQSPGPSIRLLRMPRLSLQLRRPCVRRCCRAERNPPTFGCGAA